MDIQTLQRTVRDFAAVRHWPRFHTPKNLAMALMVEAAELLEIFQWLTPEESSAAASDSAKKQHIGEEIADVQIYLLQMAEHTRVDLSAAVLDKLQRNARKYPVPAGAADVSLPGLPVPAAAGAAAAAAVTHVLLDFENVQPTDAELRALVPQATRLWVFHGPHQRGMAERFASFGHDLTVVPISKSGKNALDFHLSFYMGYIAARHPAARFVVVANDKGYEPMLEHARQLHFDVQAVGMPRVRKTATRTAAKTTAAPRKSSRTPAAETTAPVAKTRRRSAAAPAATPPSAAPEAKAPRKTARKAAGKAAEKAAEQANPKASAKAADKPANEATGKAKSPAQAPETPAKPAPRKARAARPAVAQKPARPDAAEAPASPQRGAKRAPRGAAKPVLAPASAPAAGSSVSHSPKTRGARGGAAAAKAAAPSGDSKPAAQPQGSARSASPPDAAQMARLEQGLRKLGAKRPVRLARLRGVLKSLLGGEERAAVIDTALQRLLAAGQVRVAADGAVSYPADA